MASINPDSDKPDDCTEVALSMDRLIRIWIFGDKRGIPFLQDLALYAMHKRSTQTKRVASGSLIKHILEHTTTQSALRRFHTDLLVACASASHVQKTLEKLKDVSFTTDLCLKMMEYREKEPVWNCWREWAAVDLAQYYVRGERTASGVRIVEEQNTKHGGVVYIDR